MLTPASTPLHRFYGATDKPKPACFLGSNQETIAVILRFKSPNRSYRFWGPNRETHATDFEVKMGETAPVVLKPNHWQTVDLSFEAPKKSRSSSPRAQCRSHTVSPDLPIARSLSTRPMLDYSWSSAPGLLLLPWSPSLCRTCHLHTMRQTNTILHTNMIV
jgi:hypothetical protein